MAVRRFNPETTKEIRKTPSVVVVGLWVENFAIAFRRCHAKRADLPSLLIAEDALRSYIHVMAGRIGRNFAAKLGHSVTRSPRLRIEYPRVRPCLPGTSAEVSDAFCGRVPRHQLKPREVDF